MCWSVVFFGINISFLSVKNCIYFRNIFWNETAATTAEVKKVYIFVINIGLVFCYCFIKIYYLITSCVVFPYSFIYNLYNILVNTVSIFIRKVSYSGNLSTCLYICCWILFFYLNYFHYFSYLTLIIFIFMLSFHWILSYLLLLMFSHHYLLPSSYSNDMILPDNIYYTIFIFWY